MAVGTSQGYDYAEKGDDRDRREDSIPARMEELDRAIGQLAETVSVIPNHLESILREETSHLERAGDDDGPEPERIESQLSEQLKRHREQIDRIRRQVNAAMDRLDLS